jgi:hypothetical protein
MRRVRRWLEIPPNYVGDNGGIRAAATFIAANQVEGDYLEFGVWRGYSFVTAYHSVLSARDDHYGLGLTTPEYLAWKRQRPRFFAFDSFEGLPGGEGIERMVDYAPGAYAFAEEGFRTNLRDQGVDLGDVVTVKGFYDQTCTPETKARLGITKAALVMIDCDLYESTVPVLDFLTDIVQQGTIIVFDDWFRFKGSPNHGEQRACREWLARNPRLELVEFWKQGPQAVSFLVNVR